LYAPVGANTLYRIPIVNCVPQPGSKTNFSIGNIGSVSYYFLASSMAADLAGDVFIGTGTACCAPNYELLEENSGDSTGTQLLTSLANPITSIAVDSSNNLYYVAGGALYELPYDATSKTLYAAAPVLYGSGYNTVVGVSLDALGNLYVSDSGNSEIFEIPYEGAGSTAALNPSDQYVVATGVGINTSPAFDSAGNLYYTDSNSTIYELTRGNANFGASAVGTPVTATLNVYFNQAATPATIGFVSGTGIFTSGTAVSGSCAAGTAVAAGSSCTIQASFTPAVPGVATGAVVLADSTGAPIATAGLYGTGLGAGLTADPGTTAGVGSGLKTPSSAALDATGDLFIADAASNAVWQIPAGSTTPVPIGNGLNGPLGVAVDGAGNVYIADTGHSRIVEVPVVGGALSATSQVDVVATGGLVAGVALSSPAGVSTDSEGGLYIADTGNNRVLYLPNEQDWDLTAAVTLGTGLSGPLATTVSPSGTIYIADSGSGEIISVPYPNPGAPQTVVASGYKSPSALATDAAGDLFIVDAGHFALLRVPNIGGKLAPASAFNLTDGISNPYGLALDPSGNAYITDDVNAAAYFISRTSATQTFGQWNPGATSNAQSFLIESSGNAGLTLGTPDYTATGNTADFTPVTSEASACASGASLATGVDCVLKATFTPAVLGTYSETLKFNSDGVNATPLQVSFTGTGAVTLPTATTMSITSPSGNPYYGEAITVLATVTTKTGTPSGTVELIVDGLPAAHGSLNGSGEATLSLPGGLTGGSHSLQTAYEGAVVNFSSYSASQSAVQTITVTRVATDVALTVGNLYGNPLSQPAGTALTLTAAVSSSFAGSPSGSVVFTIEGATGGTVSARVPLTASSAGYSASYSYTPPAPAAGTPYDVVTIEASYTGDGNFLGAQAGSRLDVTASTGAILTTISSTSLTGVTSVATGGGSTINFSSTSYGGWQGVIGYHCMASTLPANAICVFQPGQVSVLAGTVSAPYPPTTTTLQVLVNNPPNSPAQSSVPWWLGGLLGAMILWQRRRLERNEIWRGLTVLAAVAVSLVAASAFSACSSQMSFKTPTGSSTVTVIADSDPYTASGVGSTTQTCGVNAAGNTDPSVAPCSQNTFTVNLTVQ